MTAMLHYLFVAINPRINPLEPSPRWDLAPLNPRSIVLSVLLGSHPPEMPVGRLLEFTSLFGISDGAVRTALSRLVKSGDLDVTDGSYRLSGRLLERQREQDAGRTPTPTEWDGTWWIAVVVADRRSVSERRAFRSRTIGARFAELRPDTWIRPANIVVPLDLPDVVLTRGPILTGDPVDLLDRLWDLDGLESSAAELLSDLDRVGSTLRPSVDDDLLPGAFATLAACQRFLRHEPQLPRELSARPSADLLRVRYDDAVEDFREALRAFFGRRPPDVADAANIRPGQERRPGVPVSRAER